MTKTKISYLDFTYNPGGFGCSAGCDGCWARRLCHRVGKNIGCPLCEAFVPHLHPERLDDPKKRKTPAVIGVQFTGELFDPKRDPEEIKRILSSCYVLRHTCVFLTQRTALAANALSEYFDGLPLPKQWFMGATVRNAKEVDARMHHLSILVGKKWVSAEPLHGPVNFSRWLGDLAGIIVGCDNRRTVPFANDWARSILNQCRAAGVPCYIKQIRGPKGQVLTDPAEFPEDLQVRELPWKLRTK